jgi:hypothetical protein
MKIVELSLQKLTALNANKTTTYLALTKNAEGNLGKHVKIRWLEIAYLYTDKKQYVEECLSISRAVLMSLETWGSYAICSIKEVEITI